MAWDPVSETLALAGARCVITGGLRAGGAWSYRARPDAPIKLDALIRGSCWLIADDHPPLWLQEGDAVVLNGTQSMTLCSDPDLMPVASDQLDKPDFFRQVGEGDDVLVIGGHIDLAPAELFSSALPPLLHAATSSSEASAVQQLLTQIVAETQDDRPGASFAADQYAQLLLLRVLRVGIGHGALTHPGWLRLLGDPQLRPAVARMHAEPARAWGLSELAGAASMSRSHFAQRFREASGQPPLTCLARWRMQLAQHALRNSDATISTLADELGYASESSFAHAFARITGVSPARYRAGGSAPRP